LFDSIKQFLVRIGLGSIRTLVRIKPYVLRIFGFIFQPLRPVGRFLMAGFGVPVYRLTFLIRRGLGHLWRPAKNKLMYVISNRYTVHAVMMLIAIVVGSINLGTNEVRAETFGQKSLLYQLASTQDNEIIEEYALAESVPEHVAVSYRGVGALSAVTYGIDNLSSETIDTSVISGGSLSSPVITEGSSSVAPRDSVETYAVQTGDTLSTIATKFGLSLNTILWANNLTVRSVLRPGDSLTILPVSGVAHTVKSGDTLSKIAKTYDVSADEILAYNRLSDSNDLAVGDKLIIPGGTIQYSAPVRRPTTIGSVFTTPTTTSSAAPTTRGSGNMMWPTDLHVITQYFGWRHTGIDVDCHFDNNNYAADDGIVQYSGWKGGYGYTVEVNHGNGIVTRYGHHAKLYVSAGTQVSKGTSLGLCGTTGRSTGTHLHFEVILNGKFQNPLEYIR
jgi:LysM repeat protein